MLGSQLTIEPLENFRWESESPKLLRPVKRIYHITMGRCPSFFYGSSSLLCAVIDSFKA